MNRLAIIGAGDLGIQIANYINPTTTNFVGYIDDTKKVGTHFNGAPILCSIDLIEEFFSNNVFDSLIIGIGYNHFDFKEQLINKIKIAKIPLKSIIAPNVYIHSSSTIGAGCFILPGTVIDQNCIIGVSTILNCNVTVSHDSIISNNCFIGPGAVICGYVEIEKNCFIGANSTVIDNIKIIENSKVGAASTVLQDISIKGTYIGTPAKIKN